jgi:hypothetical protein
MATNLPSRLASAQVPNTHSKNASPKAAIVLSHQYFHNPKLSRFVAMILSQKPFSQYSSKHQAKIHKVFTFIFF